MSILNIICVDDQREVLATLEKELAYFSECCDISSCESAEEAWEVVEEVDEVGQNMALVICDHVMPGKNGVQFLTEVSEDQRFNMTKKILLTGQATHQDTINAINHASVDRYVEKPWDTDSLLDEIKQLLTEYIIDAGIDYDQYPQLIDQTTLYRKLQKQY